MRQLSLLLLTIFLAFAAARPWSFYFNPTYGHGKSEVSSHKVHRRTDKTIAEILSEDERFSKFMKVMEKHSNLRDDLDNADAKMTLFAPTNHAFSELEKLKEMPDVDMEELLHYHIVPEEEVDREKWFDGMLLDTRLKEDKLGNRAQKIRLTKKFGRWSLNMYAEVDMEEQMNAANGMVYLIDRVLLPPADIYDTLYMVPLEFSVFMSGVSRCGDLAKKLKDGNELTMFAPTNDAWRKLGMKNLLYLFSPMGKKDLDTLIRYHIGTELLYTHEIEKSDKMKTLMGEELHIEMKPGRHEHGKRRDSKHQHENASKKMMINDEAKVFFKDMPAENGVIHVIDEVLIPDALWDKMPEKPLLE